MQIFATTFVGLLTALILIAIGTGGSWLDMAGVPSNGLWIAGSVLLAVMAGLAVFAFGAVRFMGEDEH